MKQKTAYVICNILSMLLLMLSGSQIMAQSIEVEANWPAQGERSDNKQVGFSYNGPGKLTVTRYFEPVRVYGNDYGGIGGIFPDCPGCRLGEYLKMGGERCYQNNKETKDLVANIPARCEWEFFLTESKKYWGTFEISSVFWTNPAMSHQEGPQHVRAVLSYKPDSSTSIAVIPASSAKWQSVGTGDCPGRDVSNSSGPNPDPAKCTSAVRGQTAVSWEQSCTYKNIAARSCTGGSNPGRMYTCDGQAAQPVSIGNWQSTGTGDCPGRDVSNSSGPNPDPAKCTSAVRGQTAVCWDQSCTYKNIATRSCTGGSNPGRLYTCDGQAAQPVNIGNWESAGTGDCPGRDVSNSSGPNPDPAKCTEAVRDQTAVCWDQSCTYKNIATRSCTGGSNPGRMYTCKPAGRNSSDDIKTKPGKPVKEAVIFYNGNDSSVSSGGKSPRFSIDRPVRITNMFTYHYGYTGTPGNIRIISATGAEIGNWQAQGRSGSPKPSYYWEITPEVVLQPGTYRVETSNPGSWSQNAGSGGNGMVEIKGVYINP
jgi:hypothetical protein